MNREDIIRTALKAGFADGVAEVVGLEGFSRFAAIVASAEREACAEIAEKQRYAMHISLTSNPVQNGTVVGMVCGIVVVILGLKDNKAEVIGAVAKLIERVLQCGVTHVR